MSEELECVHGIWPESACSICNGRDRAAARATSEWRYFAAKYDGECAGCNLPIHVGQTIAWQRDLPIYHEGCEPR